jgi:hypothetical protein
MSHRYLQIPPDEQRSVVTVTGELSHFRYGLSEDDGSVSPRENRNGRLIARISGGPSMESPAVQMSAPPTGSFFVHHALVAT